MITITRIRGENKMSAIFDTLEYAKKAEAVGISREHAEFQAHQMAKLVDEQLVTKSFLTMELKSLEITMIKWMIGIAFAQAGLILAIVKIMIS
jgi:hypothetical protein